MKAQTIDFIQATVPALPERMVKAPTRAEALSTSRQTISEIMRRIKIVQIEVGAEPKSGSLIHETPWEWAGAFINDPTWGELFDDIGRRRSKRF